MAITDALKRECRFIQEQKVVPLKVPSKKGWKNHLHFDLVKQVCAKTNSAFAKLHKSI
jgi:hypothetical protein